MQKWTNQQLTTIANQAKVELAKRNLLDFTLYTKQNYYVNWHHRVYAEKLDKFSKGKTKKLMIFMPPQHGKSELCSRRPPAKLIGDNPNRRIAVISYNISFGKKFLREIKRIVNSEEYYKIYNLSLSNGFMVMLIHQKNSRYPGYEGSIMGTGIGGGLTGRPVDIGIIDNSYKNAQDAWSETIRNNVKDWYDTVFRSRLHNSPQQLITLTRRHPEDLAGWLLENEPEEWEVVIFPAIKVNEDNQIDDRFVGEALWEDKHSINTLVKIRNQNPYVFESLYQQNPQPAEGLLFHRDELKYFSDYQIRRNDISSVIVGICDVADEGSDYLSFGLFYIYDKEAYLMDVVFTQATAEKTEPRVAALVNDYKANKAFFESNNGGKSYARHVETMLTERTVITWEANTKNKETRILLKSGNVKEQVHFRNDKSVPEEYRQFMNQLTSYMKDGRNKHDDAADMVTICYEKILEGNKKVKATNRL